MRPAHRISADLAPEDRRKIISGHAAQRDVGVQAQYMSESETLTVAPWGGEAFSLTSAHPRG